MIDNKENIGDTYVCGYIISISIDKRFEYNELLHVDLAITLSENLFEEKCCKKLVFHNVQDLNISNTINGTYYCRFMIRDIKERQLEHCNYSVTEEEMKCIHFLCKESVYCVCPDDV